MWLMQWNVSLESSVQIVAKAACIHFFNFLIHKFYLYESVI